MESDLNHKGHKLGRKFFVTLVFFAVEFLFPNAAGAQG
jgi:hypothetical protein